MRPGEPEGPHAVKDFDSLAIFFPQAVECQAHKSYFFIFARADARALLSKQASSSLNDRVGRSELSSARAFCRREHAYVTDPALRHENGMMGRVISHFDGRRSQYASKKDQERTTTCRRHFLCYSYSKNTSCNTPLIVWSSSER